MRSPAPWEIKSLQKASIAKTLSNLTVHNQAQNLDSAKTIDCPFSHNQLSSYINYKYICIPASISFKSKKIFNQPLKILFHPKLSWQEKAMSSPAEKKGKGKVPARDYPQNKRLPAIGQSLAKHEGASSTSHRGATSLQDMYPMDTYFSRFMAINEKYISQLSGKEIIHSKDKMTIMGTDYSKFSLKARAILKSATANLPSDLQNRILKSEAINESRDLWYEHFKILVTTTFPNTDDSDDMDNILAQAEWEDYFGSSTRVYENKHPFPGLLIKRGVSYNN